MLIGLDKQRELLTNKIDELTQSIILSGINGIGKKTLILEILESKVNNTDNVHILKSEEGKSSIGIEQIRDLFDAINIMPYGDLRHYIIIDNAEQLTDVGFNSILKRLEEPKKTELFILVTSNIDALSDTIRSRCLQINIELDPVVMQSHIDKIENNVIRMTLQRMGFSYVFSYLNNDTVKSAFADSYKFISDLLMLRNKNKLSEYASKFQKDIDTNMELLITMEPSDFNHKMYEDIKQGLMNKIIMVDLLIYHIVDENTKNESKD